MSDGTWLKGRKVDASKKIIVATENLVVCDNLNTHTKGAFYEVFSPEQARKIIEKIEFHYTPKHGSWLNVAENELSSMTRRCLKDRKMTNIFDASRSYFSERKSTLVSAG